MARYKLDKEFRYRENMLPIERVNHRINYAMQVVHSHCMDRCLVDRDGKHAVHQGIRDLWISECQRTSIDYNRWEAAKHTVRIPVREKYLRNKELRESLKNGN